MGYSGCIGSPNRGDDDSNDGTESNQNSDDNSSDNGTETDDSSTGEPAIDGDEPELASGEATTVTVEASNITDLYFSGLPNGEVIEFDVNSASVSPPPDVSADSYPPRWSWSSRTSVTVEVPVTVADNAKPGEYPYK